MSAKDKIHEAVKKALDDAGWDITDDPLTLEFEGKLVRYRQIIQELLIHYAEIINRRPKPGKETEVVFDQERDHYMLVTVGWVGNRRLRNTVVYVRLRNGKFWVEEDGLEYGIATDLQAADVPKEDIVLAFHPPETRPLTEFALA